MKANKNTEKKTRIWIEWDNKKFKNPATLESHRSVHTIDIHICIIWQKAVKNLHLGKAHIKRVHKEVEITKDLKDVLMKQDMSVFDPSLAVEYYNKENS